MEGYQIFRVIVQGLLRELDPDGSNDVCHMDGYDKLKPFGFPINGAIDGFSMKVLWLKD